MTSGLIWEFWNRCPFKGFKNNITRIQFSNYFLKIVYISNFFNIFCLYQELKLFSMYSENLYSKI